MNKPLVLAALAIALPAAAEDLLAEKEVRELLAGNSTKGTIVIDSPLLGHEFLRHFAADGRLVSRNATKGETDKGSWRVNDSGAVCMKHDTWAQGREYCTLMLRRNGGYRRVFNGKPSEDLVVLPGDPFALSGP